MSGFQTFVFFFFELQAFNTFKSLDFPSIFSRWNLDNSVDNSVDNSLDNSMDNPVDNFVIYFHLTYHF